MVNNILQGTGSSWFALPSPVQKRPEEMLGEPLKEGPLAQTSVADSQAALPAQAAASNLMSGNFVSAGQEESKYLKATLSSFTVNKQLQNQSTNRVTALLDSLGGIQGPKIYEGVGSKHSIPEATIKLAMKRIIDAEEHEASERNLAEMKEKIEQKAQEAAAPKDENGQPIETGLPAKNAGESAPLPEISAPNPTPAPEISTAPEPDVAPDAAPLPAVAAPAATLVPPIDITV